MNIALANDVAAPLAIAEFDKAGYGRSGTRPALGTYPDHRPDEDIKAAGQSKKMREFARKHEMVNYFEVVDASASSTFYSPTRAVGGAGRRGDRRRLPRLHLRAVAAFSGVGRAGFAAAVAWGHVRSVQPQVRLLGRAGSLGHRQGPDAAHHGLIGVDGALYQAIITGEAIEGLTVDERFTMCNMAIEAGHQRHRRLRRRTTASLQSRPEGGRARTANQDAGYARVLEIDASAVQPTMSKPHLQQHGGGRRLRRHHHRPGRHRQLHRRPPRRPRQAAGVRGKKVQSGHALHHPAGHPGRLPRGDHQRRRATLIEAGCAFSTPTCAARASAAAWASSPRASAPWPPPTATSSAAHGPPPARVYLASPYIGRRLRRARRPHGHTRGSRRREENSMIFEGAVHKYGRDIDTDVIVPARYLNADDPEGFKPRDRWASTHREPRAARRHHHHQGELRLRQLPRARAGGDRGGRRERGRIVGTHLLPQRNQHRSADRRVPRPTRYILKVDLAAGTVENLTERGAQSEAFPPFMQELIDRGGLLPYVKSQLDEGSGS